MSSKVVCLLSGGMDSTTLLYHLIDGGYDAHAFLVDYGQRHRRELQAAQGICTDLRIPFAGTDIRAFASWAMAGSSQTSPDVAVPDGHYSDETMKITVVANRNMVMLALATAWAMTLKADAVAYAVHSGDHYIYPDCRPPFIHGMKLAIDAMSEGKIGLLAPFMNWSKSDIVLRGQTLGVPFERTWSCYRGGDKHCGRCGTDVERKIAFRDAGVPDPTTYEDPAFLPEPAVSA